MRAALHIHPVSILHVHINVLINFSASFPANSFCSSYPMINSYHWIFWKWWVSGLTLAFHSRTGSRVNTRASVMCVSLKQLRVVSHVELESVFWKKSLVCLFIFYSLRISYMYIGQLEKGELIKKKINIFGNSWPLMTHFGQFLWRVTVQDSVPVINQGMRILLMWEAVRADWTNNHNSYL